MRRHITLLAALAALAFVPACRPADAATYGKQTGSSSGGGTTYTAGTGIGIDGGAISNTAPLPGSSSNYPPGNALVIGAYRTAVLDLTQTGTYAFDMPTVAGYRYVNAAPARLEVRTRDATLTTNLVYSFLQNGVVITGLTGQSVSGGGMSAIAAPLDLQATGSTLPILDTSAFPLQVQITQGVAGSGLTTCTGRLVIVGYYTSYP